MPTEFPKSIKNTKSAVIFASVFSEYLQRKFEDGENYKLMDLLCMCFKICTVTSSDKDKLFYKKKGEHVFMYHY